MFNLFNNNDIKNLDPSEVKEFIDNPAYQVIDVREDYEYEGGHIKNSVNIPLSTLSEAINEFDKSKKLIFVCHSGMRSSKGTKIAKKAGYEVFNMKGGMLAWNYETV